MFILELRNMYDALSGKYTGLSLFCWETDDGGMNLSVHCVRMETAAEFQKRAGSITKQQAVSVSVRTSTTRT